MRPLRCLVLVYLSVKHGGGVYTSRRRRPFRAARAPSPKHVLVLTTAAIRSLFSNINFPMTGASQGSIPFFLG
jgi:hypothetical protein